LGGRFYILTLLNSSLLTPSSFQWAEFGPNSLSWCRIGSLTSYYHVYQSVPSCGGSYMLVKGRKKGELYEALAIDYIYKSLLYSNCLRASKHGLKNRLGPS
jgi:hypothetical protein